MPKKTIEMFLDKVDWKPGEGPIAFDGPLKGQRVTHTGVLKIDGHEMKVFQLSGGERYIDAEDFQKFFTSCTPWDSAMELLGRISANTSENPREDAQTALNVLQRYRPDRSDVEQPEEGVAWNVGQLKKALQDVPDDLEVIGRASSDDEGTFTVGGLTGAVIEPDHHGEGPDAFMLTVDAAAESLNSKEDESEEEEEG